MLILTRRVGETVTIGDNAEVTCTVLGVKGNQVRLGINAPKEVTVDREEIHLRKKHEREGMNGLPLPEFVSKAEERRVTTQADTLTLKRV